MPSDPSGRHPLGVLARTAPDWFDDHLGCGGLYSQQFAPNLDNFATVALFNNATDGSRLKVYGIGCYNDGGGGWGGFSVNGTIGTLQGPCSPISPDLAAPFGQIWTQVIIGQNPAAVFPFSLGPILFNIGVGGFDSNTVISHFPLAIVPPGYSLVMANLVSSNTLICTFFFQVAHE